MTADTSLGWYLSRYEDGDKEDVSFPELSEMLVRREDEPELQSDGEAAAAQDGEAKDNGGKGDNEDDSEDEDKKKGEGAEEGAEDEGREEEEKPRVALPRPVFPNLVRAPPNPILRKWPFFLKDTEPSSDRNLCAPGPGAARPGAA